MNKKIIEFLQKKNCRKETIEFVELIMDKTETEFNECILETMSVMIGLEQDDEVISLFTKDKRINITFYYWSEFQINIDISDKSCMKHSEYFYLSSIEDKEEIDKAVKCFMEYNGE
jgi:hypothetical protein